MLVILVLILKLIEISLPCPEDVWPNLVKFVCLVFFSVFNCSLLLVVILLASWLKGFLYVVVVSAHNNINHLYVFQFITLRK